MATIFRCLLLVTFAIYVICDEVEMEVQSSSVMKMLREMVNQTAAEALNLPANATSIRENITDTFSCDNRTYGYYADVDNECQIFHVCLPTETPSGRNITYKFSFICPKETLFNQEVLVCTRPRESIPCEESPSFYDLNMEIGKIADPDKEDLDTNTNRQTENIPIKENVSKRKQNKNQNRKKQNIIMDALLKEAEEQMEMNEEFNDKPKDIEIEPQTKLDIQYNPDIKIVGPQSKPEIGIETTQYRPEVDVGMTQYNPEMKKESQYETEPKIEPVQYETEVNYETSKSKPNIPEMNDELENTRLGSERSSKRTGRKIWRGSMKFKTV
ncbi:uncharacterized protein LOC112053786 [Bicyclus anynana]|uniref:Uncharacterized protein LOC112053786 n=1 Tax=Bicyclus anynana TaxID=110368 RepID=A0A6J1NZT7_BICAN|nr:uncharacterized protein LOC112053786 [Bicyclus anynana]